MITQTSDLFPDDPTITHDKYHLIQDDILNFARTYTREKFHAMLCDPPYELGFMGKKWDKSSITFKPETWATLAEHLHPGAFIFVFSSSRTFHRVACAMEDAGLIQHPFICWAFGSGFPKATRIDTAIDKAAGAGREFIGPNKFSHKNGLRNLNTYGAASRPSESIAVTPLVKAWVGHRYGLQAIKPAVEPILCFQKPYDGKPIECITRTGAGALNIDGARVPTDSRPLRESLGNRPSSGIWNDGLSGSIANGVTSLGRWPANLIHDGSEEVDAMFPDTQPDKSAARFFNACDYQLDVIEQADPLFYCAKAGRKERDSGCEALPLKDCGMMEDDEYQIKTGSGNLLRNIHPCVKSLKLCQHLATLLLPPKEYAPCRILVPFAGSGSEMIGAILAGWDEVVGIEREAEYIKIAASRLKYWSNKA